MSHNPIHPPLYSEIAQPVAVPPTAPPAPYASSVYSQSLSTDLKRSLVNLMILNTMLLLAFIVSFVNRTIHLGFGNDYVEGDNYLALFAVIGILISYGAMFASKKTPPALLLSMLAFGAIGFISLSFSIKFVARGASYSCNWICGICNFCFTIFGISGLITVIAHLKKVASAARQSTLLPSESQQAIQDQDQGPSAKA